MNKAFPFVFVRCPKLILCTQPKLVRMKKLEAALHIVEQGIIDVLQ